MVAKGVKETPGEPGCQVRFGGIHLSPPWHAICRPFPFFGYDNRVPRHFPLLVPVAGAQTDSKRNQKRVTATPGGDRLDPPPAN